MALFKTLKDILLGFIPPTRKDCAWIKPLKEGGVALYVLYQGKWQPLKLVSNNGTSTEADDKVITPVSEIKEGTSDGTLLVDGTTVKVHGLGNAAYTTVANIADRAQTAVVGESKDQIEDVMTLWALKNYIEARTPGFETPSDDTEESGE